MRHRNSPQSQDDPQHVTLASQSAEDQSEPITELIEAFDSIAHNPEWIIPFHANYKKVDGRLLQNTYVVVGPSQCGKTSMVCWAARNEKNLHIVKIDCGLYRTQLQFIQKMAKGIGEAIGQDLNRKMIVNENIKFLQLNKVIQDSEQRFVFLIRNSQRLVEYKKQILLYNLLEWINHSDIKEHVGLVFTTKTIDFTERFEKRVRSRLSGKNLFVARPDSKVVTEILAKRVEWLVKNEEFNLHHRGREKIKSVKLQAFQKVRDALFHNKELIKVINNWNQIVVHDLIASLNIMKLVLSRLESLKEIVAMSDRELREWIANGMRCSFNNINSNFCLNLIQNCTVPEQIVLAVMAYLSLNARAVNYRSIYQLYIEFQHRYSSSSSMGTAFRYSKTLIMRAIHRLEEMCVVRSEDEQEEGDGRLSLEVASEEVQRLFRELEGVPEFVKEIISY